MKNISLSNLSRSSKSIEYCRELIDAIRYRVRAIPGEINKDFKLRHASKEQEG